MRMRILLVVSVGFLLAADMPDADLVKQEKEKLQGTWKVIAGEKDGKIFSEEQVKASKVQIVISGDKLLHQQNGKTVDEATFQFNPSAKPKTMDTTDKKGTVEKGIYSLEDDILTICAATKKGKERPTVFSTQPDSGHVMLKLKRQKPQK